MTGLVSVAETPAYLRSAERLLSAADRTEVVIHLAPSLIGSGVRLFEGFKGPIALEKLSATDGPLATHIRYRVVKN